MHNFKELVVWQKSFDLVTEIYKLTSQFPDEEKYALKSQMRRSAISIPSNIAEGCGRNSDKALLNYLSISLGSQYELETQLLLSEKLGFTSKNENTSIFDTLTEIQKITFKLIQKFQ